MSRFDSPLYEVPDRQDLIETCIKCQTLVETCAWYGVSRKTLNRWLSLYGNPIQWKTGRPRLDTEDRVRVMS